MKKAVKITLMSVAGVLLACLIGAVVVYKLPTHAEGKGRFYEITGAQDVPSELELEYSFHVSHGLFQQNREDSWIKMPDKPAFYRSCWISDTGWWDKVQSGISHKLGNPEGGTFTEEGYNPWDPNQEPPEQIWGYTSHGKVLVNTHPMAAASAVYGLSYCGPADSPEEAREIYKKYFQPKMKEPYEPL